MEDVLSISASMALPTRPSNNVKETRLPRPPWPGEPAYQRNGVSNMFMLLPVGWRGAVKSETATR